MAQNTDQSQLSERIGAEELENSRATSWAPGIARALGFLAIFALLAAGTLFGMGTFLSSINEQNVNSCTNLGGSWNTDERKCVSINGNVLDLAKAEEWMKAHPTETAAP